MNYMNEWILFPVLGIVAGVAAAFVVAKMLAKNSSENVSNFLIIVQFLEFKYRKHCGIDNNHFSTLP